MLCTSVYSSIIHNSQKMEATHDEWINKAFPYSGRLFGYSGILFSHKKD